MIEHVKEKPLCRWCKSVDCTLKTSPHCYCLDCETPLEPCRCRPDCMGGNCYQPCCSEMPGVTALEYKSGADNSLAID